VRGASSSSFDLAWTKSIEALRKGTQTSGTLTQGGPFEKKPWPFAGEFRERCRERLRSTTYFAPNARRSGNVGFVEPTSPQRLRASAPPIRNGEPVDMRHVSRLACDNCRICQSQPRNA
jgi:hypothetical protein